MSNPDNRDVYLFDLRGWLLLEGAIEPSLVERLNESLDGLLPIAPGEHKGGIFRPEGETRDSNNTTLLNVIEAIGFVDLLAHESWISHINHFIGGQDRPVLDESIALIRGKGGTTSLHSGAHKRRVYTQYRYHDGEFRCGQVNILIALTDIGPGDGATMVIPGSHKSNLVHPEFSDRPESLDAVEGAVEVHMSAGDAILFVDCLAHGAARRINEGERRIVILRYGPRWRVYPASEELREAAGENAQYLW